MPIVKPELAPLRDPRVAAQLAGLALDPSPAWLWSADGQQILWANATGAALLGAADVSACAQRRFDGRDRTAVEIVRLAGSLPPAGHARLERLRGFGGDFGRALTCVCMRVALADGQSAILVAAAEPAGPALSLQERVRRVFADRGQALAVFAPDGALLYATVAAATRLDGAATLSALGAQTIAAQALTSGSATGAARCGQVHIERLGADAPTAVLLTFGPSHTEASAATSLRAGILTTPAGSSQPTSAGTVAVVQAPPAASGQPAPSSEAAMAPPPPRAAAREEPTAERRYPLRFVWQMDADGRFVVGSDEFIELVGPRTMAAFGRLWSETAEALKLDPENQVAQLVATRETWSGVVVPWPVDDSSERLPVELSGLPVFDRDRNFRGYRGFGVCRDLDRIDRLARARRAGPIEFVSPSETQREADNTRVSLPAVAAAEPVASTAPAATPAEFEPAGEGLISVTPAANVVPFRSGAPAEAMTPSLSPGERKAFRELAQELTTRLRATPEAPATESSAGSVPAQQQNAQTAAVEPPPAFAAAVAAPTQAQAVSQHETAGAAQPLADLAPLLVERLPVAVLIYRHDDLLYANRHMLQWSGYDNLDALAAAGGLDALFAECNGPGPGALAESGAAQLLSMLTRGGERCAVEGRLFAVHWGSSSALALVLTSGEAERRRQEGLRALDAAESEMRDLKVMLDAAADGAFVLGSDGTIVAATAGAEALFGRPASDFQGRFLGELFAPESEPAVRDYFDHFARGVHGSQKSPPGALEAMARMRGGETVPLSITLSRLGLGRFCAVLCDAAPLKKVEEEMRAARRETQRAAAAKADFLARVSHDIRTPLNAITGYAEVIMAERFGPIGNERYREYLKDILAAGTHLVSLLNDLLDLSKIETGQLDLTFGNVSLNDLTQQCVGIMQPQASRARIIIRTSLTPGFPQVIADERSLRQIVLNLLSNSIRFTGPGGQVIVSTALTDSGEAVLRVRDTGVGMSEKDVEIALAPFQPTATSASWGSGGTGLGLPLTKALAEANRAHFGIKSAPNAGTLVEIAFPPARVVAR